MPRLNYYDNPKSSSDRSGYVYGLTHDYMPGIVKVGASRKHPMQRLAELSASTGVPGAFKLAYYVQCSDAFALEAALHEEFSEHRVDSGREFFAVAISEVAKQARLKIGASAEEGGEWFKQQSVVKGNYPWAELFATFPDDGDGRELTAEESAKCQALAKA